MQDVKLIKSKYRSLGVSEDNFDYAVSAVVDGTKREFILESLTADYRGMPENLSIQLLEELFEANGGEFKKENRGGYLFGTLLCLVGIVCSYFLVAMLISGEWKLKFVILSLSGAVIGLLKGAALLIKAWKGTYRDTDDPFNERSSA
jgi:hypothetical protein